MLKERVDEICRGYCLKRETDLESYDRYSHSDTRISIIFPVAEDAFVGHSFAVWQDMVFDATERYALVRDHQAFERCTGNFENIRDVFHLEPILGSKVGIQLTVKKPETQRKGRKRKKNDKKPHM
jgi:hypothetical protein